MVQPAMPVENTLFQAKRLELRSAELSTTANSHPGSNQEALRLEAKRLMSRATEIRTAIYNKEREDKLVILGSQQN
ncbi:MAG: hypothetical protein QOJ99_5538 [Bryobacterales bacterium]|jgi:hypothetical protein|nr:hypothetical protein [Bryobacterales bacterium]